MKTFIVGVRETRVRAVKVMARDVDEAVRKAKDGEGDNLDNSLEYTYVFDNGVLIVDKRK